jgi:hypothetical protein
MEVTVALKARDSPPTDPCDLIIVLSVGTQANRHNDVCPGSAWFARHYNAEARSLPI